jgi:hypothetical protein
MLERDFGRSIMRGYLSTLVIPWLLGVSAADAQARSSQWWYVGQGADRVLFVDEKSIERNGDIVRYSASQIFRPGTEMVTQRAFMKADCIGRTQQWVLVMRYGEDEQSLDQTAAGYDEIQPVETGTVGEAELNFVCAMDRSAGDAFPIAIDDRTLAWALIANADPAIRASDIHARLKADPATPVIRSTAPSPATFGTEQLVERGQPIVPPRDYARSLEPPLPEDYDADEIGRIYDVVYLGVDKDEIMFERRGYAIDDLARPGSGQTVGTPIQAQREQIGDLSITILDATPHSLRYRVERKAEDDAILPSMEQ